MGDEINRIDIGVQKHLKPNQYCLLDYLIYRSNLDGWKFYISDITKNTALSRGTTHRTLVHFTEIGWVTQNSENHYNFNSEAFLTWMRSTVEHTNGKQQIGTTNTKSTNRSGDLFQNGTPAATNHSSGLSEIVLPEISVSEAPPAIELKSEADSVGQITATKSAGSTAPAPIEKLSAEYFRQLAVEQSRNMRLYGSPFGRR
jgi:hypothetical protein